MTENAKMPEVNREQRGHDFYGGTLMEAPNREAMNTEGKPLADLPIYAHFFGSSQDWYVAAWDRDTGIAWGFVCLGNPQDAEWGSFYLPEVEAVLIPVRLMGLSENPKGINLTTVVERELDWQVLPAKEALREHLREYAGVL